MPGVHVKICVKICGLTRAVDVQAAVDAGADALGFVFAASPRQVNAQQAAVLYRDVPNDRTRIGLFMNQQASEVRDILRHARMDMLQFHGAEDNAYCAGFGLPFLKAVSMFEEDPGQVAAAFPDAAGVLLDSHEPGGAGGTGKTFDWRQRVGSNKPLWLAGGLNPDNVAEAVRQFEPYAVDVSSGVESAPGIKDDVLVKSFVNNAKQAKS